MKKINVQSIQPLKNVKRTGWVGFFNNCGKAYEIFGKKQMRANKLRMQPLKYSTTFGTTSPKKHYILKD
jgi:hypothetical protein